MFHCSSLLQLNELGCGEANQYMYPFNTSQESRTVSPEPSKSPAAEICRSYCTILSCPVNDTAKEKRSKRRPNYGMTGSACGGNASKSTLPTLIFQMQQLQQTDGYLTRCREWMKMPTRPAWCILMAKQRTQATALASWCVCHCDGAFV